MSFFILMKVTISSLEKKKKKKGVMARDRMVYIPTLLYIRRPHKNISRALYIELYMYGVYINKSRCG